ncbi:hypothetical protein D088_750059 [Salmonella enterica subsp. houtenae serovar 16:z4,z32:-- str. RKS3027]|nr:hypothetical protein D088_750059 [Salmonella enterica subsp. houtenae serovar 16:z4,z32:-- str. RKS3027]
MWKNDNFIRRFADYIANQTPVHPCKGVYGFRNLVKAVQCCVIKLQRYPG